ncbi:hypothetical protein [Alcanivorax sp.]|uniref:hypothetical protein n=1 Tax=Alcanivorax sp. TaxID=1872427 RepID=UPI0025BE279A|nr:hypothetical protein [Alcanivorax sp.]
MAPGKGTVTHEGKQYHSMSIAAKLLGISQPQLKKIMVQEDFDWQNFRDNGPIYIAADSIEGYRQKLKKS